MKLVDSKGIRAGKFHANELLSSVDVAKALEFGYGNLTNELALVCQNPLDEDSVIRGLDLIWSSALICSLKTGVAVSFTGRYFTSSVFGFVLDSGSIFSVHVPEDQTVVFDSGSASDRYDTVEIRPKLTDYENSARQFKDPITGLVTSAFVNVNSHIHCEVHILKGTPGAGVAPSHTSGWIKTAEVFIPASASAITQSNIKDARKSNSWTTEANVTKKKILVTQEPNLAKSVSYVIQTTDGVRNIDATSGTGGAGNITFTLPPLIDNQGREIELVKVDVGTNLASFIGAGTDKIGIEGNAASFDLYAQGDRVKVRGGPTAWLVVYTNGPLLRNVKTTAGTAADTAWTNRGGSLTLNPGVYGIGWQAPCYLNHATAGHMGLYTLSKANNTEDDADLTAFIIECANNYGVGNTLSRIKNVLVVSAPTTFYLNEKSDAGVNSVGFLIGGAGNNGNQEIWARRIG
jgi:hypothetical protein